MKILLITDNFPPETNALANRSYEHALAWKSMGHKVTVVTCFPNYPAGKIHDGYHNRWRRDEIMEGLHVVRVISFMAPNRGIFLRTLDHGSFAVTAALASFGLEKPDVVVGTSPQFLQAFGAWAASRIKKAPFFFEVRDLWPASILAVGAMKRNVVIRVLESMESFLYRQAAGVIPVTQSICRDLNNRGVPEGKTEVVYNGVSLERFRPQPRDEKLAQQIGVAGKFVVGYLGTFGMAHALQSVLEAARLTAGNPHIHFLLSGGGSEWEKICEKKKQMRLENVTVLISRQREQMPRLWSLCDLALVHLKNARLFETVIPSKMFEAMGMGVPLLLAMPHGEACDIVNRYGAGEYVAAEDPQALAHAVLRLAEQPEVLARYREAGTAAASSFSRQSQAEKMIQFMKRTIGRAA